MSEHRIKHYFEIAKNASLQSDFPKHQLGAVAIYKGNILALGSNLSKTSPVQKKYNRVRNYKVEASYGRTNCIHAEINCLNKIKNLDIDFNKINLFVYREHKDGSPALARPCKACRAFIKDLGIKSIYYSTENGWAYERIENI